MTAGLNIVREDVRLRHLMMVVAATIIFHSSGWCGIG
jgi:hypothetical protein